MPQESATVVAHSVTPQTHVHCTGCGRCEFAAPTAQERRVKRCFVAYMVLKGELYMTDELPAGPESFTIRAGDIHILAPGIHQNSWQLCAPKTSLLWLHFSFFDAPQVADLPQSQELNDLLNTSGDLKPSVWVVPRHMSLGRDWDTLACLHSALFDFVRLHGRSNMGSHQICGHFVATLHSLFIQRMLNREKASSQQTHVARARVFMRMNYHRKISLAEVAESIGLSPAYLSRCFQSVMGRSVVDYLLQCRIQAAKEMLAAESMPSVKEVAFQTGFSSAIYFCRVFRKLERQTATEYASNARQRLRRRTRPGLE